MPYAEEINFAFRVPQSKSSLKTATQSLMQIDFKIFKKNHGGKKKIGSLSL